MAMRDLPLVGRAGILAFLALLFGAGCQLDPHASKGELDREGIEDRGYDALHYDIQLTVEPQRRRIVGIVDLRLRATQSLRRVVLDAEQLKIEGAWLFGERAAVLGGQALAYRARQGLVDVELPSPLAAGEVATLRLAYSGYPQAGIYFELPNETGLDHIPHVFTQGECVDTRRWVPCNDQPHDRATHSLTATVPSSWITVAAGTRTQRVLDDSALTVTDWWSFEREMPTYLFTFCAGPFTTVADAWEEVEVHYVCEPDDADEARASLDSTPDVLRFLSEYTGYRYPFRKYATVAVREFPFGGMENVTATTITRNALHHPDHQQEFSSVGLVAHEAAHQWFGDIITCRSWPHIWLNEGFATYFEKLYQRDRHGDDRFLHDMGAAIDSYLAACRGDRLRALVKYEFEFPFELFFDGTVYPGGAGRLQLLRGWIGETRFRDAIRHYLQRHAFQSIGTEDFQRAVEDVSGEELEQFFQQWVYAKGYPELEVRWTKAEGDQFLVEVHQRQDASAGIPHAFAFPLDLRWRSDGGWRSGRVWVTERESSYLMSVGGSAASMDLLEVDPDAWLPARIEQVEPLSATVARARGAQSVRARELAVRKLGENAGFRVELFGIAESDSFWGVRQEALNALRNRLNAGDVTRALAAMERESHPRVAMAWLQALMPLSSEAAVRSTTERILQDELASPGLRAVALQGLASLQTGPMLREFLSPWLQVDSDNDVLRKAAMNALARRLPDLQTRAQLMELALPGSLSSTREAAIGLLDPWILDEDEEASRPVVQLLQQALESTNARVRAAAANVVVKHSGYFQEAIRRRAEIEPYIRARTILQQAIRP